MNHIVCTLSKEFLCKLPMSTFCLSFTHSLSGYVLGNQEKYRFALSEKKDLPCSSCYAFIQAGLIKDTLLHVVRARKGTLPSKWSKKGHEGSDSEKDPASQRGSGRNSRVCWREKQLESGSKTMFKAPAYSCFCALSTVAKG